MLSSVCKLSSRRDLMEFALLLLAWWAAHNIYALDAHLLFLQYQADILFVDLTCAQLLVGCAFAAIAVKYKSHHAPEAPSPSSDLHVPLPHRLPAAVLGIGAVHFLGTLLTNLSFSVVGSTSTLVWKLIEPLTAVVLKMVIFRESISGPVVLSMLTALSGVLLFCKSSFTVLKFFPIILANIVFPTRNVLIRLKQRGAPSDDREKRFLEILLSCVPLCAFFLIGKLFLFGSHFPATLHLLRNALLFNTYLFAGFALLQRFNASTYSLLNGVKKYTGILLSLIILRTPLRSNHYQGLVIISLGFVTYLAGRKYKQTRVANRTVFIGMVVAVITLAAMTSTVSDVMEMNQATQAHELRDATQPTSAREDSKPSGKYVVQLIAEYRRFRRDVTFTSYEQAISYDVGNGNNVGNLVWQYAAHVALPDFSSVVLCRDEDAEKCAQLPAVVAGAKLMQYRAVANVMNPLHPARFGRTNNLLQHSVDEMVFVGLGVQAPFRQDQPNLVFSPGSEITYTAEDYPLPDNTVRFFKRMQDTGGHLLLRGDFSLGVVNRTGNSLAHSTGCPSLWINEDVHLGQSLERRYKALATRVGDRSLKVAVNLKNALGIRKQVEYIRDHYPNARFYAQAVGDLKMARLLGIPFNRLRYFTNVEDWVADLRDMDVSYGLRIHGNMIAIAAGVPVFVVASDYRVLELVQRMMVPHATTFDAIFDTEDYDVARIATSRRFDGAAFDQNRCKIGKVYIEVLGKYGIGVRQHVRDVAGLC